jgi:pyruvate formate lyase activating enzyme
MDGIIFNIERCALNDGPGIRTTIFLKGCPLRCMWCCNPEGYELEPQMLFDNRCELNGQKIIGEKISVNAVLEEAEKDIDYYKNSGGGITLSGGEPLYQPEFCFSILKKAKEKSIPTALETSGYAFPEVIFRIANYTNLFLFDYKISDPGEHLKYTGVSNKLILQNLSFINELKKNITLRCIIIPGINDTISHFKSISDLSKKYEFVKRIEIMPYHTYGKHKFKQLGLPAPEIYGKTVDDEQTITWIEHIRSMGCDKI